MENLQPAYYAVIPAEVRYDKRLKPNAKLLYGEITSLLNKTGVCWASNEYFSELYGVGAETISRWISQLNEFGYFHVELLKNEGNKRMITIDKNVNTYCQKSQDLLTKKARPIDKKSKSIYENNKYNNKNNSEVITLSFLIKNHPIKYDEFLLKYKNQILDFNEFEQRFNLKLEEEYFDSSKRNPMSRLESFARGWIQNLSKTKSFQKPEQPDPYKNRKVTA